MDSVSEWLHRRSIEITFGQPYSILFVFDFATGSSVAQANLELTRLLLPPLKYWGYRCVHARSLSPVLGIELGVLCILGKHSTT